MRTLLLTLLAAASVSAQAAYDSLYLRSTVYRNLTALYDLSRTERADIVFFGNSITYGAGSWGELLGRERVVNRGIGGDNLPGMLRRAGQVTRLRPKLCFVMAGINDLYTDAPPDTVFRRYAQLIDTLTAAGIVPVIQSTLHVNPKWKRTEEKNPQVARLNAQLRQLAASRSLDFVDLNPVLAPAGVLLDEYTTDGVHLTPAAYAQWRTLLLPVLARHGL